MGPRRLLSSPFHPAFPIPTSLSLTHLADSSSSLSLLSIHPCLLFCFLLLLCYVPVVFVFPITHPSSCGALKGPPSSLLDFFKRATQKAIAPAGGYHPSNGHNGVNGHHHARKPKYDPTFTDKVIAATGPNANPRLAQIMPSLIRHLHDFAREVNLTVSEWTACVDLVRLLSFFSLSPSLHPPGV